MDAENCASCAVDCGVCPTCGNGECTPVTGEDCTSCPDDCDVCESCGDGTCDPMAGENCNSCAADCGACLFQCIDGVDNDGDGRTDFNPNPEIGDPQCDSPTDNDESA
jgi:hypothetical protein